MRIAFLIFWFIPYFLCLSSNNTRELVWLISAWYELHGGHEHYTNFVLIWTIIAFIWWMAEARCWQFVKWLASND